jgi:hypothetical protein
MKKLLTLAAALAFSVGLYAADEAPKEVTLEGTGTCAKCDLGTAEKCTNVMIVTNKKNGKTRNVAFTNNLEHGKYFCKGPTEGLVAKGTMSKVDGKNVFTATSVEKEG